MKKILIIVLIIGIAIFAFSRTKDRIIKSVVERFLSRMMGAQVTMEKFSLNLGARSIKVEGFKLYNPSGFSAAVLLDLAKVAIEFDLIPLAGRQLHLPHVDIELKELILEKNKEGKMNVDSLKISGPPLALRADLLNLQINKVIEKDYRYEKPLVKVYDLHLRKSYRNITDINQLVLLVLIEPMKQAGIKGVGIYGFSVLTGVAVLPVAVTLTAIGSDTVQQEIEMNIDNLYDLSLKALDDLGDIEKQDKKSYTISADIHKAKVTVKLGWVAQEKTQLTVSARKYFFPSHEIASGVLYEILEEVKVK